MNAAVPCVWLVVLNYNGLADTRRCLLSIAECAYPALNTVVVDNGSTEDATPAIAAEFPWCETIRNEVNGGWAGGNNTGIRHALARGADYVVLLNNDTVVAPDLPDRLLAAAAANPDYGVIGPVINFMEEPEAIMTDGCVFNAGSHAGFFQRKPVPLTAPGSHAVTEVDIVNGCCMLVARRVFDRIGLIDERFFLIHEEADFCLRSREADFRCGVLGEVLVWHKGSSAFQRTGKGWQRYYDARNLFLLLRKHQGKHLRRATGRSWLEYLRYVNWRYCHEREGGQVEAANAALAGLCDALAGRFGPLAPDRRRPALALVRGLFESWRRRPWRRRGRAAAA